MTWQKTGSSDSNKCQDGYAIQWRNDTNNDNILLCPGLDPNLGQFDGAEQRVFSEDANLDLKRALQGYNVVTDGVITQHIEPDLTAASQIFQDSLFARQPADAGQTQNSPSSWDNPIVVDGTPGTIGGIPYSQIQEYQDGTGFNLHDFIFGKGGSLADSLDPFGVVHDSNSVLAQQANAAVGKIEDALDPFHILTPGTAESDGGLLGGGDGNTFTDKVNSVGKTALIVLGGVALIQILPSIMPRGRR